MDKKDFEEILDKYFKKAFKHELGAFEKRFEKKIDKKLDKRFADFEERFEEKMDDKFMRFYKQLHMEIVEVKDELHIVKGEVEQINQRLASVEHDLKTAHYHIDRHEDWIDQLAKHTDLKLA